MAGLSAFSLTGCIAIPSVKSTVKTDKIDVEKSRFAESNMVIVKVMWMDYDILLVKHSEEKYTALYLKCTHQDQPLMPTKTGLVCNSHGSQFDLNGKVVREPAIQPLKTFPALVKENNITIIIQS